VAGWDYRSLICLRDTLVAAAASDDTAKARAIELLTDLNDRPMDTGTKKRSSVLDIVRCGLTAIFDASPKLTDAGGSRYRHIDWHTRHSLRAPAPHESVLVVDARKFKPEGRHCDARLLVAAHTLGWRRFICYGYKGQRFTGCGFGAGSDGIRIDVYDSSGDYLASGIDGMHIRVHGNAQDQLGQIMKRGTLVIYGDVGQTFMYGAKGGDVYVLGNAAGRPLINAVGRPRVVINGTCLDYLAESFMAGDPLNGGGFVVLNGITFDAHGRVTDQASPYPGANLFSLASGGAIYLRDPFRRVVTEQLNGGEFADLTDADWELILPYLEKNQALFGVSIQEDLLRVNGQKRAFADVYRKVQAVALDVLAKESVAAEEWGEDWHGQ